MKPVSLSFSFFYFDLFIYFHFCLPWVFVAVCRLSRVAASRGYSLLRGLFFAASRGLLIAAASLVAERRLQALGLQ